MKYNTKLDIPDESGLTQRYQLTKLKEQKGLRVPILDNSPEYPEDMRYYHDLYKSATSQKSDLHPLSYTELQAWSNLTQINPDPIEVNIITLIDRVVSSEISKFMNKKIR